MKASKLVTGFTLATLLISAAQGAAIKPLADPAPGTATWEEGAAMLFPVPVLTNPWVTAPQGAHGVTVDSTNSAAQAHMHKQAAHPFADSATVVHGMDAKPEPAPMAVTISEPASEVLMLIGLSALAIAIRRKMPE